MGSESLKDELARAIGAAPAPDRARVTTARVSSVSGGRAQCVIAGDSSARTSVALAGAACRAGDTIAVAGQSGRWYGLGVVGACMESKTLVSNTVTAYRHMGWVVVRFDNYVPCTSEVTSPTSVTAGTLPKGWRPPARFKGNLYVGSVQYCCMGYVETGGAVKIYTNNLGANQQVSGYVIYPATQ